MHPRNLLAAGVAVAFTALAASASAQGPDIGNLFKAWDGDGDGVLSPAEWTKAGREEDGFKRVDADHDGKITIEELKAAIARMRSGG